MGQPLRLAHDAGLDRLLALSLLTIDALDRTVACDAALALHLQPDNLVLFAQNGEDHCAVGSQVSAALQHGYSHHSHPPIPNPHTDHTYRRLHLATSSCDEHPHSGGSAAERRPPRQGQEPVRHRHHGRRTVRIQRPDHRGPRAVQQHQGGAKVLEEVGVRTSATEQYVIQKSRREFDSTIISTDIISTEFAKPFTPPTASQILCFKSHNYMGEPHPVERKVVLTVKVSDIKLTDTERHKLLLLCGPRYNPERDELKFSAERFPYRPQNKKYLSDLFDRVVEEAK
ncbi:mitochondrial ribosomal subunit protein-domain-containing protein, partial [Jimgerdemannia flammicorona]